MAEDILVNVKLRPATLSDSQFLFALRNDPLTRSMSKNQGILHFTDHERWFAQQLEDQVAKIWVGLNGHEPVGQFRVGREGQVSVAVAPKFREQGFLRPLIEAGSARAIAETTFEFLVAHVRLDNERSLRGFLRAGYVTEKDFPIAGEPYRELIFRR